MILFMFKYLLKKCVDWFGVTSVEAMINCVGTTHVYLQ